MKSGSGADDPFEDFDGDDDDEDDETLDVSVDDRNETTESASEPVVEDDEDDDGDGLPRIYERSSVKGERSEVIQLQVRQPTVDAEQAAYDDVKQRFDDNRVYLTDFREAAYLVAMEHLDEVEEMMDEWGYSRQ